MQKFKVILTGFISFFSCTVAFCQSEALKPVVNNLAYYQQKKDLKYLGYAKKSIDSLRKTKADSADLEKSVYLVLVNSGMLYIDSLNKLKQPANQFTETVKLIDKLADNRKIIRYGREMDFAKRCIANIYLRRGFKYLSNSDYLNAVTAFKTAQRYYGEFVPLNSYLAYCTRKLGKLQEAADYYDKLISANGVAPEYYETASNTFQLVGDTAKALEILKKARTLYPDNRFLLADEANIYSNQRDFRSLVLLIKSLLDNNPNNADIAFVAANCYDHLYAYNQAEKLYIQSIGLNDAAFDTAFNLGLLYLKESAKTIDKRNDLERAGRWLEKANEILPNDRKSLKLLQILYTQTGNAARLQTINNKLNQLTN